MLLKALHAESGDQIWRQQCIKLFLWLNGKSLQPKGKKIKGCHLLSGTITAKDENIYPHLTSSAPRFPSQPLTDAERGKKKPFSSSNFFVKTLIFQSLQLQRANDSQVHIPPSALANLHSFIPTAPLGKYVQSPRFSNRFASHVFILNEYY